MFLFCEPPLAVYRRLAAHSRGANGLSVPTIHHIPTREHAFHAGHGVLTEGNREQAVRANSRWPEGEQVM